MQFPPLEIAHMSLCKTDHHFSIFQFYAALLQRWDLPEFMCQFCPFTQTLSVNVSIFTLVTISVDRYTINYSFLKYNMIKSVQWDPRLRVESKSLYGSRQEL